MTTVTHLPVGKAPRLRRIVDDDSTSDYVRGIALARLALSRAAPRPTDVTEISGFQIDRKLPGDGE